MSANAAEDRFRPIGWWLEEADTRLEHAFAAHLSEHGLSRRAWQILASVARGAVSRSDLVDQLAEFDPVDELDRLINELQGRGWLSEDDDADELRLTASGTDLHRSAAAEVDQVRRAVATALPGEDYQHLVGLLGRLIDAFPPLDGNGKPDGT